MTNSLDIIRKLLNAGVHMEVPIPMGRTDSSVSLSTAAEVERFLEDPDGLRAAKLGLTPGEYQAWLASAGYVVCSGRTAEGKKCKALVTGAITMSASEWAERTRAGELCPRHS